MEELRKTPDLVKKEKTTLFEGAYTCPACGHKKIEVRTIFSSNRIVK